MNEFGPVNPKWPRLWFGGDYNPDQWPEATRREDWRLMKLCHATTMSVGIFAWSQLEPEPGRYDWSWLDEAFERLPKAGVRIALATPSAAHPRWLSAMHPEVQAVDERRVRLPHGVRQRFCPSSPVYREEVARIDRALAERYRGHSALVLWHVSNEYGPACWCDLCAERFRAWLRDRYGDLATLNAQWWSSFWSHRFGDWSEVIPPYADCSVVPDGLVLDWKRFQSHQVCDFFKHEVAVLKSVTPDVPVTTNLMGFFAGLDYAKFADAMDVVSWDCYADVGGDPAHPACDHAMMRGLKAGRPWLLVEQTPSSTNWKEYPTLKPPGVMRLWSWQAMAHGSDASMYFQWRRTRGGHEKFHGAFVPHEATERPRVFQEMARLGEEMERAGPEIVGTRAARARVGILWDQENRWALEGACGPGRHKRVVETLHKHYKAVWRSAIPVDVVRMDADWAGYDLLIAPMLYMVKSGRFPLRGPPEETSGRIDEAAKIAAWVEAGGTFVATYLTGIANESDLVYEGGYPGPLRKVLGVWAEELDVPPADAPANRMVVAAKAFAGAKKSYRCGRYCDLLVAEGARVLARYGADWYKGRPCLTVHSVGEGLAYYLATDAEDALLRDLYRALARAKGIEPLLRPVEGVEVLAREGPDGQRLLFLLNHAARRRTVALGTVRGKDLLSGRAVRGQAAIEPRGVRIVACT
jgi:beta-galactosidase